MNAMWVHYLWMPIRVASSNTTGNGFATVFLSHRYIYL